MNKLFVGFIIAGSCIAATAVALVIIREKSVYADTPSTVYRGVMSPKKYRESDFKTLGEEWKANLIRWQLEFKINDCDTSSASHNEYDEVLTKKILDLDSALNASKKYGLKVVIDLHSPPGGRDENKQSALFYNKIYNDHFVKIWEMIATRYKNSPALWAYDLVNEPVQVDEPPAGFDYRETQTRAIEAIRKIDSVTPIIFEVTDWDSPLGYESLIPLQFSNIIYGVHMYYPYEYTHQGVQNDYYYTYPGIIEGKVIDKNTLKKNLDPVRNFQLAYNVPIYVGEFSAIRWAPGSAQYISDCIDIFEEYGWNWTYHAYREWNGWDVEYQNGLNKDSEAVKAATDTDRKKVLLKAFAKNI
jgi:endoglucanase